MFYFLTKLILETLNIIKGHIQSNLKVPHPTLVALGISSVITAITVGIFYMVDIGGLFGIEDAEAAIKKRPKMMPEIKNTTNFISVKFYKQ